MAAALSLAAALLSSAPAAAKEELNPSLVRSFDGLNHFAQFMLTKGTTEPPEQGLCVGNGFVVESVSGAIATYVSSGNLVWGPRTLNDFYGYPPPRGPAGFGPQLADPTCYFDSATQRWFHVVLTMEVTTSPRPILTGVNHIDIAVSQSADPTGAWKVRKIMAPSDCSGPCIADFPHIGADTNGFYVTTNDYNFFTQSFRGARIYAFSKRALETNTPSAAVVRLDTVGLVRGQQAGFTVWPAQSPNAQGGDEQQGQGQRQEQQPQAQGGDRAGQNGDGTEFFLSSNAADEVNVAQSKTSRDLIVWALSGTDSLDSREPHLKLATTVVTVGRYSVPPAAHQKQAGTLPPLAQCLNDATLPMPCWARLLPAPPAQPVAENQSIDSGDTRMQQVMYSGGILYGALGTAVTVGGERRAGIEWFAIRPQMNDDRVRVHVVKQGYLGQAGTDLVSPAIAVNQDGVGAIGFSLMGQSAYPSAAYAPFNVKSGTGEIRIAAAGLGPDDGLTAYASAFHLPDPRTRWGDYGAAAVDGSSIWMASEYIGQTCTYQQWLATPFSTCGGTRGGLANWYTRVTEVSLES